MSPGITFLRRVGSVFRADGVSTGTNGVVLAADLPRSGNDKHEPDESSSLNPWVRRRRQRELAELRSQHVFDLMEAMRVHFERQDQRSSEMTEAIARVGSTLEQLACVQRSQGECVAAIAARMNDAARHSGGLLTMLAEMPASMQAQAEAVRAVAQQMEASRSANGQLVASLRQFSEAADSLRDSGAAQTDALQRLNQDAHGRSRTLQESMARQNRLMLTITIIACVLGVGLVTILALAARIVFFP